MNSGGLDRRNRMTAEGARKAGTRWPEFGGDGQAAAS